MPINVASELVHWIAGATRCKLEGFPQTYLGLALSNIKLNLSAFALLISKTHKYLACWQVLLLFPSGSIILLNSVLDDLPIYVMAALLLPKRVLSKHWTNTAALSSGSGRTNVVVHVVSLHGTESAGANKKVVSTL